MKLAWALSILAQCWLVLHLWNRRDWWTCYLIADLARSALLWWCTGEMYYWIWLIGQFALLLPQLLAALERSPAMPWGDTWILAALAVSAWVIAFSPSEWPAARQAALIAWHMGSMLCLAILLRGAAAERHMLIYYALNAATSALILASPDRTWARAVGGVHSLSVAGVFSAWALAEPRRQAQ